MKTTAKLNNLRISPRKVRLVTDLIKGQDVENALIQLKHLVKKTGSVVEKLLKSAIANAENNLGLDRDNLYVFDIEVGEGSRLKRWMARAHGRATPILKRTSTVTLTLEERVEGKNRKSKEQLEKERKEREEARRKLEREIREEEKAKKSKGEKEKKEEEAIPFREKREEEREETKTGERGGWMKRMFRRKSG